MFPMAVLAVKLIFVLTVISWPVSDAALTCHVASICSAGGRVNCTCATDGQLTWIVKSSSSVQFFRVSYSEVNKNPSPTLSGGTQSGVYNAALFWVDWSTSPPDFHATLGFSLIMDVIVECRGDTFRREMPLQIASSPSSPLNLQYNVTSTSTESANVTLDWSPPLHDGGVAITSYHISVNMSIQVVSTGITAILVLNSTGEHLIEIEAVNSCARISESSFIRVNITAFCIPPLSNSLSSGLTLLSVGRRELVMQCRGNPDEVVAVCEVGGTWQPDPLDVSCDDIASTFTTASIVVLAIALLVTVVLVCTFVILTGLLVRRRRSNNTSVIPGPSSPIYEEVFPLPCTLGMSLKENAASSMSLKENAAYGDTNDTMMS